MGAVLGLLGIGGSGSDFKAQAAQIRDPFSTAQSLQADAAARQALTQYQGRLGQVVPSLGMGLQHQGEQYQAGQDLAGQLAAQAAGQGPNPALAQLANSTGQNVAQTAALMAGARGSSANPGLIARQAGQAGAGIQQQAAGQAAALSAEQQLAARQQQQALMAQQTALANQQLSQGASAAQGIAGADTSWANYRQGQIQAQNQASIANAQQQNAANAGVQAESAKAFPSLLGGLASGVGSALAKMAGGGEVPAPSGPRSHAGRYLSGQSVAITPAVNLQIVHQENERLKSALQSPADGRAETFSTTRDPNGGYATGGSVKDMRASGGRVPGKAKVKGDSYANDTVNAKLSPQEIVLPRSVTQSKDPVSASARFVAAVLAQRHRR